MRQRQGFTLIELLVAMALSLFIMVILSEAFVIGLETFSGLKGIGDMSEKLRAASTALRADLAADHFEAKRRLSDPDFYTNRPQCGFVRVYVGTLGITEGADADGISSYRSSSFASAGTTYGSHILHLSAKRRGSGRGDFFSAAGLPAASPLLNAGVSTTFFNQPADTRVQDNAATYNSQWAEVAYVLVRTGSTSEPNVPKSTLGTPLYALYRVQRVVLANTSTVNFTAGTTVANTAANRTAYATMSFHAGNPLQFNSPSDLTTVANRAFNPAAPGFTTATSANQGASLLMMNVVSFHVRILRSVPATSALTQRTLEADFSDVAGGYDSSTATTAGTFTSTTAANITTPPSLISAISISLRVYDQKTQQTRQITVVQDM